MSLLPLAFLDSAERSRVHRATILANSGGPYRWLIYELKKSDSVKNFALLNISFVQIFGTVMNTGNPMLSVGFEHTDL